MYDKIQQKYNLYKYYKFERVYDGLRVEQLIRLTLSEIWFFIQKKNSITEKRLETVNKT